MSEDRGDLRMIEDYIPVREISVEATREKIGGHRLRPGHLSTLHLWWARRPLAAARAAIYATFAPPATEAERDDLPQFFRDLSRWTAPVLVENDAVKHARSVVEKAAEGQRPKVLDMFAGGGAIPLEALRLGCDAVAVDLNPVAHLIQRCTLVYPQKYGRNLRDAVAQWGEWVIAETQKELGDLYRDIEIAPTGGGEQQDWVSGGAGKKTLRPIAWLWTRTVPSPAPGCRGVVPLVRQTWLRYKVGNYVALKMTVDRENERLRFEVVTSRAKTETEAVAEWGFDPGEMSVRGATVCPFTGAPVSLDYVKEMGKLGRMGVAPLATVVMRPGERGKAYLSGEWFGDDRSDASTGERLEQLVGESGITPPDEPIEERDRLNFKVPLYGLRRWRDLFTSRQLLLLLTLCENVREAHRRVLNDTGDAGLAEAVAAYLGLLVGRVADRSSTLCRWRADHEETENTYSRQALPMVWDFSEANPFGGTSGDARLQLTYVVKSIEHGAAAAPGHPSEVVRGLAQRLPLPAGSVDAVVTDPPYYDNISYADLSDFFYVWHKRALGTILPDLYATTLTPKKPEAVAAPQRHRGDKGASARFYEDQMRQAFAEAHRVLKPGGPLVVVYAHKTTLGWSTLVDSLRAARFQITEAWPLSTEMPDRAGQMDTASLASSIFLVARKREGGGVGPYATEVRPEMARVVAERVRDLMAVGISGADLVIAAVGAGLRPFTRYDRVELPSGEELPSSRFLDEVQREVLETVLAAVFDVPREGVGQVDKASRFYVLARYQYGAAAVDFGELNVLAQGIGIELSGPGSLSDGARALVRIAKKSVALRDHRERGAHPDLGLPDAFGPAPLVDVLHRALWLLEDEPGKLAGFFEASRTDVPRLRLLANALKGRALAGAEGDQRTDEQKAVDRLLAQWARAVETKQISLFEPVKGSPR